MLIKKTEKFIETPILGFSVLLPSVLQNNSSIIGENARITVRKNLLSTTSSLNDFKDDHVFAHSRTRILSLRKLPLITKKP